MKRSLLTLGLGLTSIVFAHGPKAEQASSAVEAATRLFLKSSSTELSKAFYSVSAVLAGHERFTVTITTNKGAEKNTYDCTEYELVEPVEWRCKLAN